MKVVVGVYPERKTMLKGINVPDVKSIIHRLNTFFKSVPCFSVVRTNRKTHEVELTESLLHFCEMTFTVKLFFTPHCIHFAKIVIEERVFINHFNNGINLMEKMLF